ncbi:hypothetical protein EUGRSUZ_F01981 [Eucalyptus grandis]|uniref:WRKY domain-containing protein n=2 Tax=Eucalyptus grandis TaxID=71139 RepID=A0A059BQJ8_EUCGR|nr:hypothetical protein EUGRSUZ_F01981 [Eucalyptus grandis]
MSGADDNVAVIGDWVPPSPSPRTFFTAMLGDDIGLRSGLEASGNNKTGGLFLGSQERVTMGNFENKDTKRVGPSGGDHSSESRLAVEQKGYSRGCLGERLAARAGFNAPRLNTEGIRSADLSSNPDVRSPYLTIPPGLSPTTLLDSPVFLSNTLAQPSPTTGKFPFIHNNNSRSSGLMLDANTSKDNPFEENSSSSFAFKPLGEASSSFFGAGSKMNQATFPQQSYHRIEVSVQSENSVQSRNVEATKLQSQNGSGFQFQGDFSRSSAENVAGHDGVPSDQRNFSTVTGDPEHSPPLDEQQDDEGDQRISGDSLVGVNGGSPSEDGYNWRKYGQKQVKGSEYPRSYYKCTHPSCQVKKKVERSHEGHITEIIYKGAHNHPKPPPNRRSVIGGANPFGDMQLDNPEQMGLQNATDTDPAWANMQKTAGMGGSEWRQDNLEVTSSPSDGPEFSNAPTSLQAQNGGNQLESGDQVDASSTFSNDECDDEQQTHGSVSLAYDGEEDESDSKRRKIEAYATDMSGASRAIREPRVVVQTTSEVDILDDGYRWRKYGQKVVKGNPNPRSYYKCTSPGCTVRKHVERASHDLKSVITTYEGKHNHDVPAARNSSHVNSGASSAIPTQCTTSAVQTQVHRPEPSQVHSMMGRYEGPGSLGSFSLPGRQQLGPGPGFSFAMNPPRLANFAMAGMGPGQGNLPMLPVHPFLAQQHQVHEMGFMLPKGEPKAEPMSEPGPNLSNNSSVYQHIMSRLPLGPQM